MAHKATFAKHNKMSGAALKKNQQKTASDLKKAQSSWRASIVHMHSVVKQQETKLLGRLSEVSRTEAKNKELQAHANRRLYAEVKRVNKVGMKRERAQKKAEGKLSANE